MLYIDLMSSSCEGRVPRLGRHREANLMVVVVHVATLYDERVVDMTSSFMELVPI